MSFTDKFDELHERAIAASDGLSDFGPEDYVAPMKLLLSDLDRHSRLGPVGEQMLESQMVSNLSGRLRAHDGFARYPQFIAGAPVKPLILVGALRTGSTALLTLLSKDPGNQGLEYWLAHAPQPRPPREAWDSNPQFRKSFEELEAFNSVAPIEQSHPIHADQADECLWVIEQTFYSPGGKGSVASVPDYLEWCMTTDAGYAYSYYRKVLALISGNNRKRWVLKNPSHLWAFDALLETFPDACIVFTHRDIPTAMTSMASLIHEIRHPCEPDLSRQELARELMHYWGRALDKAEKVRRRYPQSQFLDVHIDELHRDPVATVERIYKYFGFSLTEEGRAALTRHIEKDPRAGHGAHHYKADEFGISPRAAIDSVGEYYQRYQTLYGC